MKYPRILVVPTMVLLMLLAPVTWAQDGEEDTEEAEPTRITVEVSSWIAQAIGLNYISATQLDPGNPFSTSTLAPAEGTEAEFRYRGTFALPRDLGAIAGTWYSNKSTPPSLFASRPGEFVFGETLAHPLFAGVGLDGLADAVDSTTETKLTDFRLDYYRPMFKNSRIEANWFIGWRRVKHNRTISSTYHALVPDLPPLIPPLSPPVDGLIPNADTALMASHYNGRGINAGMDFLIPVFKKKVFIEAGFAISALRGNVDTTYASTTNYFTIRDINDPALLTLLGPPYSDFGETDTATDGTVSPRAQRITQRQLKIGLDQNSISTSSSVIEAYLGFRWRAWRTLEAFFGIRDSQYNDIGLDRRPGPVSSALGGVTFVDGEISGVNLGTVEETSHSATYEGLYFGLAYSF
jgi:hypothetical protein